MSVPSNAFSFGTFHYNLVTTWDSHSSLTLQGKVSSQQIVGRLDQSLNYLLDSIPAWLAHLISPEMFSTSGQTSHFRFPNGFCSFYLVVVLYFSGCFYNISIVSWVRGALSRPRVAGKNVGSFQLNAGECPWCVCVWVTITSSPFGLKGSNDMKSAGWFLRIHQLWNP